MVDFKYAHIPVEKGNHSCKLKVEIECFDDHFLNSYQIFNRYFGLLTNWQQGNHPFERGRNGLFHFGCHKKSYSPKLIQIGYAADLPSQSSSLLELGFDKPVCDAACQMHRLNLVLFLLVQLLDDTHQILSIRVSKDGLFCSVVPNGFLLVHHAFVAMLGKFGGKLSTVSRVGEDSKNVDQIKLRNAIF